MFIVWVKKGRSPFWNVAGWSTSQEGAEKIATKWDDEHAGTKVRIKASGRDFITAKRDLRHKVEAM